MKPRRRWGVPFAALALGVLTAALAQPPSSAPDTGEGPVRTLRLVSDDAGRADWSRQGDRIAFDRVDREGYARLYVARPDGREARCLTCDPLTFRKRHTGNPVWHPSGRYLAFEVAKPFRRAGSNEPFLQVPGRNLGNDIWLISDDGRAFYNLTGLVERGTGGRVHAPAFSREGDRLAWAERVAAGGGAWGQWALRVAELSLRRGVPRLRRARGHELRAGQTFYEPSDFTPDDRGLVLAADRPGQGPEAAMDLYELRLDGGDARVLTGGEATFNRHPALAPNGDWIVWASNRDVLARPGPAGPPLDLWMMRLDGGSPQRLTRFNDVFSDDYSGAVAVRSASWSPDGDRLLITVEPLSGGTASLYILELDRPYGR